jgi:hypothetical protein
MRFLKGKISERIQQRPPDLLKMPHPLTSAQWEKIESILKAYKPADETKEN